MSSLRDIRQKLHSIENIKKITQTMERIAAARLHGAQMRAEQSRPYIIKMKEILENVAQSDVTHPLLTQREVKKTGLLIVSGDRGLSGAYNTNVFSTADKFLKAYKTNEIELILLGKKAIDHYSKKKWPIRSKTFQMMENRTFHEIAHLSNQLVRWFLDGELDEIWLVYTHFTSILNRNVVVEKFLNIGKCALKTKEESDDSLAKYPLDAKPTYLRADHDLNDKKKLLNYMFEPKPQEILSEILPRYCITRIQTALYESYASELSARIIAMQTASKNSEDLIEKLTLLKNKTRQRDITREVIEIISGAQER